MIIWKYACAYVPSFCLKFSGPRVVVVVVYLDQCFSTFILACPTTIRQSFWMPPEFWISYIYVNISISRRRKYQNSRKRNFSLDIFVKIVFCPYISILAIDVILRSLWKIRFVPICISENIKNQGKSTFL